MIKRLTSILAISSGLAFGQAPPTSNWITVTATLTANIQPDQVVFSVSVTTPTTSSLTDALNVLQGSGITAANLTGLSTVQQYNNKGLVTQTVLQWTFSLPVAFSNMKSTIGLLSAVQASNAAQNNNISISFSITGTQVSPQAQAAQQCSVVDLLSDAQAQAQKLASAAGKGLGPVLAMSSATTATQSAALASSPVSTPACSMTVKFQLMGF
jgi:uncharacterized protein YggE